ncbi:hypothetical protein [Massilia sp. CF038]|uniref:hypothetical protein n=1 Tax=Massilia sp. CF038 TaxID=1881045 RepID=UPI00090FD938|nr:hypothetical protein [Massilia sp. CF038]SHH54445.1 hypothetical protein SAMN05428948_4383 [Massilia sp. CF038]
MSERDLAYLIIRNAQHLDRASGLALAERARRFTFNYFRNRCILKLRDHVPAAEIKALFDEFMHDFRARPAQSELIHNLYHFSAVCPELPASEAIDLALEKIAMLDDSGKERWAAGDKYNELSFLAPLLRDEHQARAFAIAQSVWGGHRNNLLSRLRRHFSQQDNFCEYRYPGLTD